MEVVWQTTLGAPATLFPIAWGRMHNPHLMTAKVNQSQTNCSDDSMIYYLYMSHGLMAYFRTRQRMCRATEQQDMSESLPLPFCPVTEDAWRLCYSGRFNNIDYCFFFHMASFYDRNSLFHRFALDEVTFCDNTENLVWASMAASQFKSWGQKITKIVYNNKIMIVIWL